MDKKNPREISPTEVTFDLVGGKYKGAILWYIHKHHVMRFSEIVRHLPACNVKMVTQQLRAMEQDNLLCRTVYPEVPPRVEYSLTRLGESLFPVIQVAHQWGIAYVRNLPEEQAPITEKMRKVYETEIPAEGPVK